MLPRFFRIQKIKMALINIGCYHYLTKLLETSANLIQNSSKSSKKQRTIWEFWSKRRARTCFQRCQLSRGRIRTAWRSGFTCCISTPSINWQSLTYPPSLVLSTRRSWQSFTTIPGKESSSLCSETRSKGTFWSTGPRASRHWISGERSCGGKGWYKQRCKIKQLKIPKKACSSKTIRREVQMAWMGISLVDYSYWLMVKRTLLRWS